MSKKDYYKTLDVPKNATDDQIKQAYRKLAREHHPDVAKNGDKKAAEEKFKEINEAYQVLSDSQKRKMYDQFGQAGVGAGSAGGHGGGFGGFGRGFEGFSGGQWGPFNYTYTNTGGGSGTQGFEDFDPFDVFEDFFGFRGFGGRQAKRGKSLHYEMSVDFGDAVCGVEKTVNVESGKVTVKIPAGAYDGLQLKFVGKGMPGPNNTPAGDLFITFRVSTPAPFERFGENLAIPTEIDFVQAVLGDDVDVPVIDPKEKSGIGTAKLKIPNGIQPGTQFRLKGRGMPRVRGGGQGDIIVQIFISIPKKLNKRQKELLEEYKNTL